MNTWIPNRQTSSFPTRPCSQEHAIGPCPEAQAQAQAPDHTSMLPFVYNCSKLLISNCHVHVHLVSAIHMTAEGSTLLLFCSLKLCCLRHTNNSKTIRGSTSLSRGWHCLLHIPDVLVQISRKLSAVLTSFPWFSSASPRKCGDSTLN
jgi:hypothetical protein